MSTWDPVVATLPDHTTMVSKTYINEVDINTVKVDQKVEIGLDAFPEKKLTGTVIEVANVGEQKPNTDAHVSRRSDVSPRGLLAAEGASRLMAGDDPTAVSTWYDHKQYNHIRPNGRCIVCACRGIARAGRFYFLCI